MHLIDFGLATRHDLGKGDRELARRDRVGGEEEESGDGDGDGGDGCRPEDGTILVDSPAGIHWSGLATDGSVQPVGTPLFASIAGHTASRPTRPADDVESLVYTL